MITVDTLREYGANVDEGLGRCMNNEALYIRLANMILGDTKFDTLREAIAAGDLNTAYEAAHGLKGSLLNLALTPMAEPVARLSDTLKEDVKGQLPADARPDYPAMLAECLDAKARFDALAE